MHGIDPRTYNKALQRTRKDRPAGRCRNLVGVGRTGLVPGPSSLRTVRAVLPHTALQSAVHLLKDWQAKSRAADRENSPCLAK
jgi:hypothetical protein